MNRKHEAGQALVLVALALVVLVGFLGLGVDFGYLRYMKRNMQNAADAAAIAGAIEVGYGDVKNAAVAAALENGYTITAGNVHQPPIDGPYANPKYANYVEVIVTQTQPTFFSKIFGVNSVAMTTSAVAVGSNNCIYGLNSSGSAISMGLSLIDSACGVVDNSSLSGFLGGLCAPTFQIVGSVPGFGLCPGGHATAPNPPTKIASPVADPFASVPAPTAAVIPCVTYTPTVISNTFKTLNPGTYCGQIQINNSTVIFNPGPYVIAGGALGAGIKISSTFFEASNVFFGAGTYTIAGGITDSAIGSDVNFNVTGGGNNSLFILDGGGLNLFATFATGNGVTFYNSGTGSAGCGFTCYGAINNNFSLGSTMAAPTTGPYAGILYFQNRSNAQTATFAVNLSFGSGNNFLQGAYYFPNATVSFDFDFGNHAAYSYLVAKNITWLVAFTINNDLTSFPNGSPLPEGTAVLVQ